MDEKLCRLVYLALRTAPALEHSIRGIAALRKMMIDAFGFERQRELIGQWNELPLPPPDGHAIPRSIRALAEEGIACLWTEAGMPVEMLGRLHLYSRRCSK
ncbi:MAG: hypothetical protein ACREE4_16570 [Stellaceae bacterium]